MNSLDEMEKRVKTSQVYRAIEYNKALMNNASVTQETRDRAKRHIVAMKEWLSIGMEAPVRVDSLDILQMVPTSPQQDSRLVRKAKFFTRRLELATEEATTEQQENALVESGFFDGQRQADEQHERRC